MSGPIRVLVIDDSALMRQILAELLSRAPGVSVAGAARDAHEGRELIKTLNPDVVTLDVEMPGMDGLSFLERIMMLRPMPVVMVSSLTRSGADATVRALELGAVDCVAKPAGSDGRGFEIMAAELLEKIRIAAVSKPGRCSNARAVAIAAHPPAAGRTPGKVDRFIALGASTGGVERIRDILTVLPGDTPPMVITQHIGATFVPSFAARLDKLSAMTVAVAENGAKLERGHAFVAPGDRHLSVIRDGRGWVCRIEDTPPMSGHRPSVDHMFHSVAKAGGAAVVGVILSGMGKDGAQGMRAMRDAGARTIGESEGSCVVYGMPKAAKEAGAVEIELPLNKIPTEILRVIDHTP